MTKKIVAFLVACVACQNALYAEEPLHTYTADEMVVTTTRFAEQEKKSSRFVTVVSSDKLKKTGASNAMDALGRIGGLGYKSLAPMGINKLGMNSAVYIRGIEDGELVLINGMPVQQGASKGYDLSAIAVDQIERIEVLKGASSTLYGADAMAGVINIITKKPVDEKSASASFEFGSNGWMNHGIGITLPGVSIGLRYQHMDELDDIGRQFSRRYTNALDETDKLMLSVNTSPFARTYLDYQYTGYETAFINRYDSGRIEKTDQESRFHFLNLRYEGDAFKAKLFGVYDNRWQTKYNNNVFRERLQRLNYNYGAEADYRFVLPAGFLLTAGVDYVHRFANYENNYGEKSRHDYGVFAELKRSFGERLFLTLGVREQFIDNKAGVSDYDVFLPSVGLNWQATDRLNVFVNAGKAFQAPTFTQLYYSGDLIVGNPDLKPESGWSYETGLKWNSKTVSARAAVFYMVYDDKIEIDRSMGTPYHYFNAGSYETRGIEWELGAFPFRESGDFLSRISFSAAGYWADPVAEDPSGKEYQPGPKFQNTFGISYASHPARLDLKCRIQAGREDALESFTAFDLIGKLKAGQGYLTFGMENIFDTEIQTTGNLKPDASSRFVNYEPGRTVKIGYSIAL